MRQSKISRREFLEPWVGQQPGWRWARPQPSRRHRIRPRLRLREFLTRVLTPFTWKAGTSPGRNTAPISAASYCNMLQIVRTAMSTGLCLCALRTKVATRLGRQVSLLSTKVGFARLA